MNNISEAVLRKAIMKRSRLENIYFKKTRQSFFKSIQKAKKYCSSGWPTKVSLFFFGNNFYRNKETFKIFSLQILEVYRIPLV